MAARSASRKLFASLARQQLARSSISHLEQSLNYHKPRLPSAIPHAECGQPALPISWVIASRSIHHAFIKKEEEEVKQEGGALSSINLSIHDTKLLLRHAAIADVRAKLNLYSQPSIPYDELVAICKECGAASSDVDAGEVIRSLDAAGVILLFQGKAFLQPQVVADAVANALPLPLLDDNDPRSIELKALEEEKKKIDEKARRSAQLTLWLGLGFVTLQTAFFFRLTFWELSWDVMEPITFFATTSTVILSYAYFLLTSSEPSYTSLFEKLFKRKRKKLVEANHFNIDKYRQMKAQRDRALGQQRRAAELKRATELDDD